MNTPDFPKTLGPYTLIKSLGKGGMGEVFLAHDPLCQRNVALKQIRIQLQKFPSIRARFLREARIAAQLSHPSIIPIFSISDKPENSFYTMPYIEGSTLKEILKDARESPQKGSIPHLARIFLAICHAVAYAHSKNILHRDLKPENVIVGKFGEVMILDWGLAQALGEIDDLEEIPEAPLSDQNITRAGKVVGTLAYLAPERACLKSATPQTDLYALGVVLFQILTLKMPFKRLNLEVFQKQWQLEVIPNPIELAPQRDIPHALSQIALNLLSPDPKNRYLSVADLIADIEAFIEGKPDWILTCSLKPEKKEDWEFQELILLSKHMAISQLMEMEWIELMISKKSFPGNVLLETTVELEKDSHGIGFLLGGPEKSERKELMEGFCLWIGAKNHPGCQLFRTNVDVMNIPSIFLEPEKQYSIRIEKTEHHLKLFIDDHLRLHYLSQTPLFGSQIGVVRRDANLKISPLKISLGTQNVSISCLAIPDAFLTHKDYPKALSEYRKIATSFPGRMEGREALYRAGITLIQAAGAETDPEIKENALHCALEEFGKLKTTAGAPLEYLGKSMVYEALKEWEEEAKCLELAIRRYRKHPLFPRLEEHLVFRLHQSSSYNRAPAYHLAFVALKNLPHLFSNPDHLAILNQIQKQWEHLPYFPPDATLAKLAFLLNRPLALMEIATEGSWVEETLFALLDLGHKEIVRESSLTPHHPPIVAALKNRAEIGNPNLSLYLLHQHFDEGNLQEQGLPPDPLLRLEVLLSQKHFKEAGSIFESFPIEELKVETSPLFTLFGCYLWAVEGEEIALAHFSGIEEMRHPPVAALLAYFVMKKIDLSGNWFNEAFFWEKLSLLRQKLLLAYCLNDTQKAKSLQAEVLKLKAYTSF
jgi:serine/threonine-protein kinase